MILTGKPPLVATCVLSLMFASFAMGQDTGVDASLGRQLAETYEAGDAAAVRALVVAHRLDVKPIVHDLISRSLESELDGRADSADVYLARAGALASDFENAFGERSLGYAVNYVARWSAEDKRVKLRADSLAASAGELRGQKETRERAFEDYQAALQLYRQIGDRIGEGEVLGGLGFVSWYFGDADATMSYFEEALKVRVAVDDRQLVGNSYNDIALASYAFLRDYERALENHEKAEQVRTEIGDLSGLGRTLSSKARTYDVLGDLDRAQSTYQRAAEVLKSAGDIDRAATALSFAGSLLSDLGRYSEALVPLHSAREIRTELGDTEKLGDVLNFLGIAYRRLGNFEEALENYQKVVELAQKTDDKSNLATAYSNIGVVYLHAERPERSIRYFERARNQFSEIGETQGVLDATINLGSSYFEIRDYDRAEVEMTEALRLSRELEDKMGECTALVLVGNVWNHLGAYDESISSYEEGLVLARELNVPDLIFAAVLGLGEANERRGAYEQAIARYEQAFDILESTRGALETEEDKSGFLAQQRYAYEAFVHMLAKLHRDRPTGGYDRKAFLFAERAKARSFLDLLAEALADVRAGVDPELLSRQDELLGLISQTRSDLTYEAAQPDTDADLVKSLQGQLAELETAYADLERELRTRNPKYADLQYPQPSGIEDIQSQVLDDNTIVIEYAVGDSSTTLWVISRTSTELVQLSNRDAIKEQIELTRYALTSPDRVEAGSYAETSHRLFATILEPAIGFIPEGKNLVIIPDDVLFYLPFEALVTKEVEGAPDYGDLPYLIRRNPISYAQSASVLQQLTSSRSVRKRASEDRLLAFGDPVFSPSDSGSALSSVSDASRATLQRLPFSGDEVRAIAQNFSAGNADVYLEAAATEEQAKAAVAGGRYRFIHFATHGLIDEDRPDFSSVVLSQDDDPAEDGYLQAAEIFNLELDADLVVLSACETGLGRMVRGEGIVGLTRAFMYAGAPSLLVSLWQVADQSTSALMQSFYRDMVVLGLTKIESIRRAKMDMIGSEAFAHPFHWAPFVLTGDWQ